MTTSSISKLISAFLLLVIGIVLLGSVATSTNDATSKDIVYNESNNLNDCVAVTSAEGWQINTSNADCNITVTNAPSGWKQADCPLTSVVVRNGTSTALTVNTDYVVYASTGIIQMKNTTATENLTGNNTYEAYTYCSDGYINIGWGRSILNLVAGFFALAILGISLMLFYSIAKEEGVM